MRTFLTLLAFCLLLPGAAHADPVTTIVALVANGASIGAALTATLGTFGAFLVKAAAYVAFSLAGQLLQPQRKVNITGIQTEQTTTGDVTPLKFVLGRYGLEGHLVAPAYSHGGSNGKLNYILEVSNIPITDVVRVAVDGEWYEIDRDPKSAHADYGMPLVGLEIYNQTAAWIKIYDGTQSTADPMLVEEYGDHDERPWTSDHILEGTAYVVMTFQYRERLFSGLPAVRFEIDGIPLYDPRKDTSVGGSGSHRWDNPATWEFTRNPQVMSYNVARGITLPTGDVWGGEVPAEDLPLDAWFAAMNECDDLIGDRVKYQAGFEVDVSVEPFEVIRELNKASFTQLSQFGGIFRPRTGPVGSAVMGITDDDILITEPSDLDPFPGLDKTHNSVTGTFIDPAAIYQGRAADPLYNAEWEVEDGGRRLTLDVGLPAVTNKSQAQHVLDSFINDDRRFRVHRIALPPSAAVLEPLDAISWDSDHNGYTDKIFEVVGVEDRPDTVVQVLTIRERDAGDVDWSPDDDVADPVGRIGTSVPADLVPTISVTGISTTDAAGEPRRPGISLTWPSSEAPEVELLRQEVRLVSTETVVAGNVHDAREGLAIITAGLVPNTNYEARAQYIQPGYPTDWSDWESVTTPDVRLGAADLSDEIVGTINAAAEDAEAALERHDAALDEAEGTIAELRGRIEATFGSIEIPDIPEIPLLEKLPQIYGPLEAETSLDSRIEQQTRRIDLETSVGVTRDAGLEGLAEQVVSLHLQLGELSGRVTDAGIFIDPASGKARIEASGLTGSAQVLVDGLAGEISNRATYADVDAAIAEANFDPSQIADLQDVYLRLSTAEATVSAQDASITSLTETLTVEGGIVTMATVTQDITSLEAAVATKVEQTEVDALGDRVTVAEQELEAFDGAAFRTVLTDVVTLREDQDTAIYASLEAFLANRTGLEAVQQAVALARQEFWARAEGIDDAVAGLRVDLAAETSAAIALIEQESIARAGADIATASDVTQIELRIDDAEADISAQAGALDVVEGRVEVTETGLQAVTQRAEVTTAAVGQSDKQLGEVALRALLDEHAGRARLTEGVSQVRRDTLAQVEAGREALAEARQELTAALAASDARITTTQQALATETEARVLDVAELEAGLADADAGVAGNAAALSEIDTRVSSAEGSITSQAGSILQLQSDVSAAQGTADGAQSDADANAGAISALDTRVSSAEGAITSQATSITELESDVGDNAAAVSDLAATRVTASGAVAAIDSVVDASFDGLDSFAGFALWAIANENGSNAGFRFDLGGDDVISAVRVLSNGNTEPETTVKLAGDHIILDGNTSVLGSFYTEVLAAEEAWITSAMIAEISTSLISIDGVTIDTDGEGNLIVGDGGVGRDQLEAGASTDFVDNLVEGNYFTTDGGTWAQAIKINLGATEIGDVWYMCAHGQGRTGLSGVTGGIRARRRVKVDGIWSDYTILDRTFSDEFNNGYAAFNFFDVFGGVFEDVEFELQTRATYGSLPDHTHRHLAISARKNVK
ncbi:hypothetical protein [Roseovarius indicus]|uniref:hypothetical protein n=1 Tax=Roseovarius indicus TaxID=540747 RepID=UPI0032EBC104